VQNDPLSLASLSTRSIGASARCASNLRYSLSGLGLCSPSVYFGGAQWRGQVRLHWSSSLRLSQRWSTGASSATIARLGNCLMGKTSNPPVNADACGRAAMHAGCRARAGYRAR
jgi:hypothetical protein